MVALSKRIGAPSRIPGGPAGPANRATISSSEAALDAQLVRNFMAGDEGAFDAIVARYSDRMHAIALRHLRNHADAEEIAQDTFIRAHRGLANFRGESSLSTWLHRIAFNLSRNRHKHNFSRRRHVTYSFDCALLGDDRGTFSDFVASDAPTPERVAASREFSELVLVCMEKLGVLQREVLEMRNGQSQSYEDIARNLGISIGTVKSRIGRGRESLRALLAQSHPDLQPGCSPSEWFEPMRPGGKVAIAFA